MVRGFLPARRDADVRKAQHAFDACPFAEVIPFDGMTDILQRVAENQETEAQPGLPEQNGNTSHGKRNAEQMDGKIKRMLMAL